MDVDNGDGKAEGFSHTNPRCQTATVSKTTRSTRFISGESESINLRQFAQEAPYVIRMGMDINNGASKAKELSNTNPRCQPATVSKNTRTVCDNSTHSIAHSRHSTYCAGLLTIPSHRDAMLMNGVLWTVQCHCIELRA